MSRGNNGSVINYKINEVLGPEFKRGVTLLGEGLGITPFLYKNLKYHANVNEKNINDDDIWYHFSDFIIASSVAFRHIENPDKDKIEITEKYSDQVASIVDDLLNDKSVDAFGPNKDIFSFDQLPYHYKIPQYTFDYLVKGFHLLPYTQSVYTKSKTFTNSAQNPFVNCIRYLYHFVALIDTKSNPSSGNIIDFLRGDAVFMHYVDQIVNSLMSTDYFKDKIPYSNNPTDIEPIKNSIKGGVIKGFQAVVQKIISKYNTLNPMNIGIPESTIKSLEQIDFSGGDAIEDFLKKIGIKDNYAKDISDFFNLFKSDNINWVSDYATKMFSPDINNLYRVNALLNPSYMVGTQPYIDSGVIDYENIAPQKGGLDSKFGKNLDDDDDSDLLLALPFMYGPPLNAKDAKRLKQDPALSGIKENSRARVDALGAVDAGIKYSIKNAPANTWETITFFTDYITDVEITNVQRVILLSILVFLLVYVKKDLVDFEDMDKKALVKFITDNLRGYAILEPRLDIIPISNFNTEFKDFRDIFVTEFVLGSYKNFAIDSNTGNLAPRTKQIGIAAKNNLSNDEFKNFYKNIVVKDTSFYNKFFNLIYTDSGLIQSVPLETAKDIEDDSELAKYRLNVKKSSGRSELVGGMHFGGQPPGGIEIVITSLIPDYSKGNLYLDVNIVVPESVLQQKNLDALRYISRTAYSTPTKKQLILFGNNINLNKTIDRASKGLFNLNLTSILEEVKKNILKNPASILRNGWKDDDIKLSEHQLRTMSKWERDGDRYIYKDDDGKVVQTNDENNCKLINASTHECMEFFSSCIGSTDDHLSDACKNLFDFKFNINPPMDVLSEWIRQMDPSLAFGILKQFKFGQATVEEVNEPVPHFRRFKIQSVASWLNEMRTPIDRCKSNGEICGSLREELGKGVADQILKMTEDENKWPFFNYLSVLVHWVNANPQILNIEEAKKPYHHLHEWQEENKSFKLYRFVDPHKPADYRLRGLSCGLDRLKNSIINQLTGSRAESTISTVAGIPLGIQMPLGRHNFTYPINPYNTMYGGEPPYDDQGIGGNYSGDYEFGYKFFDSILRNLLDEMNGLNTSNKYGKKINLSSPTKRDIETKLENLKNAENSLRDSMVKLIKQKELYHASRGYIDIDNKNITDEEFATLLGKHSNLINVSKIYNKKAENMIDMLQIITKAVLDKVDKTTERKNTNDFTRPIISNFRYDSNFYKKN